MAPPLSELIHFMNKQEEMEALSESQSDSVVDFENAKLEIMHLFVCFLISFVMLLFALIQTRIRWKLPRRFYRINVGNWALKAFNFCILT